MWNRRAAFLFAILVFACARTAAASDEEGCLFCHRLELVRSAQGRAVSLRVWDPPGGSHSALRCSDCHPDARNAPHAALPGPASCIGACHGSDGKPAESHRQAAFGGLTEVHRPASAPFAPCRVCHRAGDRARNAREITARCEVCHAPEAASVRQGIHVRLPRETACVGCHPPHRDDRGGPAKASCEGGGCHRGGSERTIGLAGHDARGSGSGAAGSIGRAGLFLLIVLLGWSSGRFLCAPSTRKEPRQ